MNFIDAKRLRELVEGVPTNEAQMVCPECEEVQWTRPRLAWVLKAMAEQVTAADGENDEEELAEEEGWIEQYFPRAA